MEVAGIKDPEPVPASPNRIEILIAQDFSSPSLWTGRERPFPRSICGGLEYIPSSGRYLLTASRPNDLWLSLPYGVRAVPGGGDGGLAIQTTELETITLIGAEIRDKILRDEGVRVATLVDADNMNEGESPTNNLQWLRLIAYDKIWPIMRGRYESPYSPPAYFPHDYSANHLGNFLLFPNELQDLITQVAQIEIGWRGKNQGQIMLLDGETSQSVIPYEARLFGRPNSQTDGGQKIDHISNDENYMLFLSFLVAGREMSCENRLALLREAASNPELYSKQDPKMFQEVKHSLSFFETMHRKIGDCFNFIIRHTQGRNATEQEVDKVFESFLKGTVRVAEKVRGTNGTTSST